MPRLLTTGERRRLRPQTTRGLDVASFGLSRAGLVCRSAQANATPNTTKTATTAMLISNVSVGTALSHDFQHLRSARLTASLISIKIAGALENL